MHLCFADDLFIFAEASMQQVEIIKHWLQLFENSSGQKGSQEKTKIYFLKMFITLKLMKLLMSLVFR